jgi:PTH1 family peptidyl-tRNA hydrolase
LKSLQRTGDNPGAVDRMIVGLGNPGSKYASTRHNLGFAVVGEIARRCTPHSERRRFEAIIVEVTIDGRRVALVCPQTMMNNSGYAVAQIARWYRLAPADLLVVHDELDLPFGRIRVRPGGGPGGHNGVRSIIEQLGTSGFPRVRIGIGRPSSGSTVSHVLSRFRREEEERVPEIVKLAVDAAVHWATEGLDAAMNQFNRPELRIEEPVGRGSREG